MKKLLFIFSIIVTLSGLSQGGQSNNFAFLNTSSIARQAALGGSFIAIDDQDPNLTYMNPSMIDSTLKGNLSVNVALYPAEIQFGTVSYTPRLKSNLNWTFGTKYMNYGKMRTYNTSGEKGDSYFYAGETAIYTSVAKEIEGVKVGVTGKVISSFLAGYNAFGIALDAVATYSFDSTRSVLSMKVSNLGRILSTYSDDEEIKMPTNVQLGYSRRLEHLPLRLFVTLDHMNKYNLVYDDPIASSSVIVLSDSSNTEERFPFMDNLTRHFVVGSELQLGKGFYARLGYNFLRRAEMKVDSRLSTVGISWGVGFKFKKWNLAFARSKFHLAQSPSYLSVVFKI